MQTAIYTTSYNLKNNINIIQEAKAVDDVADTLSVFVYKFWEIIYKVQSFKFKNVCVTFNLYTHNKIFVYQMFFLV